MRARAATTRGGGGPHDGATYIIYAPRPTRPIFFREIVFHNGIAGSYGDYYDIGGAFGPRHGKVESVWASRGMLGQCQNDRVAVNGGGSGDLRPRL